MVINKTILILDGRNSHWVELFCSLWIKRDTDFTSLGMYTEWCFQQVIHSFGNIYIQPWVCVLEHNFLHQKLTPFLYLSL